MTTLTTPDRALCLTLASAAIKDASNGSGMAHATRQVLDSCIGSDADHVQSMCGFFATSLAGQAGNMGGYDIASHLVADLTKVVDEFSIAYNAIPDHHTVKKNAADVALGDANNALGGAKSALENVGPDNAKYQANIVVRAFKGFRTQAERHLGGLDSELVLTVSGGQNMADKLFILETANQRDQRKEVKALEAESKHLDKMDKSMGDLETAAIAENVAKDAVAGLDIKTADHNVVVATAAEFHAATDAATEAAAKLDKGIKHAELLAARSDAAAAKVDGLKPATHKVDTVDTIKALMSSLGASQLQELADFALAAIPAAEQAYLDALGSLESLKSA